MHLDNPGLSQNWKTIRSCDNKQQFYYEIHTNTCRWFLARDRTHLVLLQLTLQNLKDEAKPLQKATTGKYNRPVESNLPLQPSGMVQMTGILRLKNIVLKENKWKDCSLQEILLVENTTQFGRVFALTKFNCRVIVVRLTFLGHVSIQSLHLLSNIQSN